MIQRSHPGRTPRRLCRFAASIGIAALGGCVDRDPLQPGRGPTSPAATVPLLQAVEGTTVSAWVPMAPTESSDWELAGAADMTGDARPDIVWQNRVTRQTGVWTMDGTTLRGWTAMPPTESGEWEIGGVAHLAGDPRPDVVWHNRRSLRTGVWVMHGVAYGGWVPTIGFESGDWQIGGVADMTGDGHADVVWQNRATRQTGVWVMSGTTYLRWVPMAPTVSGDWEIGGAADMTGDGRPDIVWQNRVTRQTGVWTMDGTTLRGWTEMPPAENGDWRIGAVADMTGDGRADIVWQNRVTRQTGVWVMGGRSPPPAAVTVQVPAGMRSPPFDVPRSLTVPAGWRAEVFARVQGARFMAVAPNGDLLVSEPGAGKVWLLRTAADGSLATHEWAAGLRLPHDVVFHTLGGTTYVYVAESHQVSRSVYQPGETRSAARQVVVAGLPDNTSGELQGRYGHQLKNIALHGDRLFVSIASPSNADPADREREPKGGAIYLYPAAGGTGRLWAQGLRNAEGLAFVPGTADLWVAVNNRDNIAYPFHQDFDGDGTDDYGKVMQRYTDNHPPEPFTRVRDGGDYGWPFCNPNPDGPGGLVDMPFDRDVQNNADGSRLDCARADRVSRGIQAHSAPLGLTFLHGSAVPAAWREGAAVALHGSWNHSSGVGYKVIFFPWNAAGSVPRDPVDLVSGFDSGGVWGRPVDVAAAPDGSVYVSDDHAGAIYRLRYSP